MSKTTDAAIEAAREIDNLLSKVSGVNDERDSVPILLGIRERWPKITAAFPYLVEANNAAALMASDGTTTGKDASQSLPSAKYFSEPAAGGLSEDERARILSLLEAIRDNDANDMVADAVTCEMAWRKEAGEIHELLLRDRLAASPGREK